MIFLTLLIRVYIRAKISPPLGADDQVTVAATTLALLQSALVLAQTHEGYGSSLRLISDDKLPKMEKVRVIITLFYSRAAR